MNGKIIADRAANFYDRGKCARGNRENSASPRTSPAAPGDEVARSHTSAYRRLGKRREIRLLRVPMASASLTPLLPRCVKARLCEFRGASLRGIRAINGRPDECPRDDRETTAFSHLSIMSPHVATLSGEITQRTNVISVAMRIPIAAG